jgi:hypothetical protein
MGTGTGRHQPDPAQRKLVDTIIKARTGIFACPGFSLLRILMAQQEASG